MELPYGWIARKYPGDPRTVISRKWDGSPLYAVIEKPRGSERWYIDVRVRLHRPDEQAATKEAAVAKAIAMIEGITRRDA